MKVITIGRSSENDVISQQKAPHAEQRAESLSTF